VTKEATHRRTTRIIAIEKKALEGPGRIIRRKCSGDYKKKKKLNTHGQGEGGRGKGRAEAAPCAPIGRL